MLDVTKIKAHEDEALWKEDRLGHFTASEMGKLISENSHKGKFTKGAITYIQGRVAEIVTNKPAKAGFHTVNTDYGQAMEPEAIRFFCEKMDKQIFRTEGRGDNRILIMEDEYSLATPDALVLMAAPDQIFSADGLRLKVAPLEIKCPPVLHRFMKLYSCLEPKDLKAAESLYYWQLLTQMLFTESLIGYFACYHPDFPQENRMRVLTFNQIKPDIASDAAKLKATIHYAKEELKRQLEMFKN